MNDKDKSIDKSQSKLSVTSNAGASSSSATGNPRNKTALKPGHSLMDWIRLGSSGVDLAGTKGKIVPVNNVELAKHNKIDDAYIAIRGKVYNVTRYMDFHPGGSEELMRGVGKDATKIFDEVHSWVNYEQLLSKCFVGPLRNTVTLNLNSQLMSTSKLKLSPPSNSDFKTPAILSISSDSINKAGLSSFSTESSTPPEVIPRFDWIQKTADLSIIFYTKSLCNPAVVIEQICDNGVDVKIFLLNITFEYIFSLTKDVHWPCVVKIAQETGKVEITFAKVVPELWVNFGIYDRKRITDFVVYAFEYKILSKTPITHDSYAIILHPIKKLVQVVPLGFHCSLTAKILGNEVTRSYTPVSFKYASEKGSQDITTMVLLVKHYNSGVLSRHITQESFTQSIMLSQPKGGFDLNKLKYHTHFGLLAAGSGITPMLGILEYLLDRSKLKVQSIVLHYFNKSSADIWCREELELIAERDKRFTLHHILSEPEELWDGETGRVSSKIINTLINKDSTETASIYVCVCGPTAFNDVTKNLFKKNGFDLCNLHCFQA